jgi:chaperonin GroEL
LKKGSLSAFEKEVVEGMQFDKGYVSPYMITDSEAMKAVFEDPYILMTDKKIASIQEILTLLEKIAQSGKKDLVIIAEEIEGEALATFVVNKLRGTFNVLGIKAPGFGDRRKAMLDDIAVLTGGTRHFRGGGSKTRERGLGRSGTSQKSGSTKENTTIVEGKGEERRSRQEWSKFRKESKEAIPILIKKNYRKGWLNWPAELLLSRLEPPPRSEMKEKKDRIEDALNATRAAVEEGVVPGGGLALGSGRQIFEELTDKKADNPGAKNHRHGHPWNRSSKSRPTRAKTVL